MCQEDPLETALACAPLVYVRGGVTEIPVPGHWHVEEGQRRWAWVKSTQCRCEWKEGVGAGQQTDKGCWWAQELQFEKSSRKGSLRREYLNGCLGQWEDHMYTRSNRDYQEQRSWDDRCQRGQRAYLAWGFRTTEGDVKAELTNRSGSGFYSGHDEKTRGGKGRRHHFISVCLAQVTMLLSEGWTVELESGTFWSVFPIGVWQQYGAWVWSRHSLWHHVKPMGTYAVLWTWPCELSRWATLPGEYSSLSSHTFWKKEYPRRGLQLCLNLVGVPRGAPTLFC